MSKVKSSIRFGGSKVFLIVFTFIILNGIEGFAPSSFAQFNKFITSTIAINDSNCVFDLGTRKLAAVIMPATVTAATFTVYTTDDTIGTETWYPVYYEDAALTVTATDGKMIGLKPVAVNQLMRFVRLVGNVKEAAARTLKIVWTNF